MLILGVWDGHDSGAALIEGGRIVFAANEERFTRKKLEIDFPALSIKETLKFAGLKPQDVKNVAISTSDFAKTLTRSFPALKRRYYKIRRRKFEPSLANLFSKKAKYILTEIGPSRFTQSLSGSVVRKELQKLGFSDYTLHWVGHHQAHAAAAVCTSGFEKGLFLSLDGIGDGLSGKIGTFEGGKLRVLHKLSGKHSLGIFFEHVTNLLNMRELEDEGKVMALASFGYPVPDEENPILNMFTLDGLDLKNKYSSLKLYKRLHNILWQYPSEQFAYMAQRTLEVYITKLVENACEMTGLDNLVYAGGVASNIKVNMLIKNSERVKNLFVFPHMGDGGLAIGAAAAVNLHLNNITFYKLDSLFLGPEYAPEEIEETLKHFDVHYRKGDNIIDESARLVKDGNILLWFQGRMEYGPRALGNRSILALPDSVALKNRLNIYLKERVWYQPFCPTILEEDAAEVFEDYNGVNNRFMTVGYTVKDKYADKMLAVINADNSCRPQILGRDSTRYSRLLQKMKELTGFGVVLNTSMNKHGEPIINSPAEALELLTTSRFNHLVLEDYLVWTD
jgi:carbamoyltransferase